MSDSEAPKPKRVRVMIVDDSALVREMLTGILSADPDIEVVGTAPDPLVAREKIKALNPDVITLDVEMPHMSGIEFLEKIMRLRPMPVVMISTLTQEGADTTLRALELGAVDYVAKPTQRLSESFGALKEAICSKVKMAATARVRGAGTARRPAPTPAASAASEASAGPSHLDAIAIGASTGGVEAIGELLSAVPPGAPGILIVQHMPGNFTGRFAARLDATLPLKVVEAQDGAAILPGCVYIGPGGRHLALAREGGGKLVCRVTEGPAESGHVPSVDHLFRSMAQLGNRTVGVILTGMGRDGAAGLKLMREAGALTIAQDAATSVVYGMPRVAVELDAAAAVLPLSRIAAAMLATGDSTNPGGR
jgi:two-component system, chemotaxis family, protein-glutamate methylesterase/glutaminase